jgi:hypothetical protein
MCSYQHQTIGTHVSDRVYLALAPEETGQQLCAGFNNETATAAKVNTREYRYV